MKNTFDGLISKLDMVKERISEFEDVSVETSPTEMRRTKRIKTKKNQNIQELWHNFKKCYISVIGIPEGEERLNGAKEIFEVTMKKNCPKLMTGIKTQIQEAQRTLNRIHIKK